MRLSLLLVAAALGGLVGAGRASAACDPAGADVAGVSAARAAVVAACDCASATSHAAFVRCAREAAAPVLTDPACLRHVVRCARMSTCGLSGAVACCRTAADGMSTGAILRDASRCTAPTGGSGCVAAADSVCDACASSGCVASGKRTFRSGFESAADFAGFYVEAPGHRGSTSHELSGVQLHSGASSHRAWMFAANDVVPGVNTNHRGYPTVQLYKLPGGPFGDRVWTQLWVWLDVPLEPAAEKDWFSFATFTAYADDLWSRTILVNLAGGTVRLVHVPGQGEQVQDIFQTTTRTFPMRRWVRLDVLLDFTAANPVASPYGAVWQDGRLVSAARFDPRVDPLRIPSSLWPPCLAGWDGVSIADAEARCGLVYTGRLAQAHFGLYAPPLLASGEVYNDDLLIREVD